MTQKQTHKPLPERQITLPVMIGINGTPYIKHSSYVHVTTQKDELIEALEAAIKQIKSSKEYNAPIKQSFSVKNLVANVLQKTLAAAKGDA